MIYFYYLELCFLDQSIKQTINLILKTEALAMLSPNLCILILHTHHLYDQT